MLLKQYMQYKWFYLDKYNWFGATINHNAKSNSPLPR